MNSMQELSARLQQVERSNRRMKLFGGLGLALCLVGFAAPKVCDVVTGERLVLHDESGRTRVSIDAYRTSQPAVQFTSSTGKVVGTLAVNDDGIASLTLFDAKGVKRGTYQWGKEPETPTQPEPQRKTDTVSMAR
ncbi:MAG: hypothetical protein IPJ77_12475 [Planctomycetes bacterium]|nr:hypothetical protein [Planctomycetota bacterium]